MADNKDHPLVIIPLKSTFADHKFKPGNTTWKPKGIGELRAMAKHMAAPMLQTVIDIALDEDQKGSVRLAAADMVLTRAYGKPDSYQDRNEDSGKASDLSSSEILRLLQEVSDTADPNDKEAKELPDMLTQEVSDKLETMKEEQNNDLK